jgi:hypothetical protein
MFMVGKIAESSKKGITVVYTMEEVRFIGARGEMEETR